VRTTLPFRTDIWLLLLIASQPLESAIGDGVGSTVTVTKLAGALCVGAFALDWFATRRPVRFDVTHAILLMLLAIGLLSSLQALSQPVAVSTMTRYAGFVALYVVLTQFVDTPREWSWIAWALSAGCAIAGALAVWNFADGATLLARPTHGDPNDLAYMLATTLPLTLWLLRYRGGRRVAAALMIGAIVLALVLSFSRGAWLASAAGVLWLVVRERRYRRVVLVAGLIGLGPVLLFVNANQEQIARGLTAKSYAAVSNVTNRVAFYRVAAHMAEQNPLLGIGPGNFPLRLYTFGGGPNEATTFVVHDAYLAVAAELGIPALLLFVTYLLIVFRRATSAPPTQGFDVAVRVALVIAIVGALPLSEQYYSPLWVLGGLATVLRASTEWPRNGSDAGDLRFDA
jgi:hypothetical protein